MGRAAVRKAVAEWLGTSAIPNLGTVLRARPKEIDPSLFKLSFGQSSGAVIVVHLPDDNETRAAMGGKSSGEKFDDHVVTLEIFFQSTKANAMDAQDDHDALIDGIKARLREDRNLGNAKVVWQAPDKTGYRFQMVQPVLGAQTVQIAAYLTFIAKEYVQA